MDALLGAAALGDIGDHFPDTDEKWKDARSVELLTQVRDKLAQRGYAIRSLDATRACARRRGSGPYRDRMRAELAAAARLDRTPGQRQVRHQRGDGLRRPRRGHRRAWPSPRSSGSASFRAVREIRIHDTLTRRAEAARAARSRQGRDLRLRADGLRAHPRRQRAPVRRLLAAEALPRARGLRRRRSSSTSPTSTTRSTPPPRIAGSAQRGARARDDRGLHRRHRRARARAAGRRAEGRRDGRPDRRPDPGAGRPGRRLSGRRGRRLLPRRLVRRLREALEPRARGHAAGRGRRRPRRHQGGAAGLRALEGPQGGRGHLVAVAVGRGPARLAHRVLGDGRGDPGRRLRHPRRRRRPGLPAPRERDRPDRGRARTSRSRGSGCTTAWSGSRARRWPSRWATSACCTRRSTRVGRDTLVMYFVSGHYRQPLVYNEDALADARGVGRADARLRAAARPGRRRAGRGGRLRGALLRRAGRRLQHAGRARRRCSTGSARPTAASTPASASAPARCPRCCACSASRTCSRPTTKPDEEALKLLGGARKCPQIEGFRDRGRAPRRAGGARLDRARHRRGPAARAASARGPPE